MLPLSRSRHHRSGSLTLAAVVACAALTAAACGDGDAASADAFVGPDASPGPDFDRAAGAIEVIEGEYRDKLGVQRYGRVQGTISPGGAARFHTETMRAGSCRLLEFAPALCEPFCDGICAGTNDCRPFPTFADAGTITLAGLEVPMTLVTDGFSNFYNPAIFPIPEDLFADGAVITATASGADVAAFEVSTVGVAAFVPDIAGFNIVLANGADATLTWTPRSPTARVRLTLNSPNTAHGQPFTGILECEGPDTGALVIPQPLVEAFPATFGQAICVSIDCPPSRFERYSRGLTNAGATSIELIATSRVELGVVHDAP